MLIVLFFGGFNCNNNPNQASYVSFLKKPSFSANRNKFCAPR